MSGHVYVTPAITEIQYNTELARVTSRHIVRDDETEISPLRGI